MNNTLLVEYICSVRFENNNYKLVFKRLYANSGGLYTCVASNEAGSTEMTFEVDVQGVLLFK